MTGKEEQECRQMILFSSSKKGFSMRGGGKVIYDQ